MDGGKIDKLTNTNRNKGSQIHAEYVIHMGELMVGTSLWQCLKCIQETDFNINPRQAKLANKVNGTGSRSCLVVGFSINGVGPSGYTNELDLREVGCEYRKWTELAQIMYNGWLLY
jgi:hypothetical protein